MSIPAFNLFGETGAFPDVIHVERIWDRARLHDWEITPHRHHEMVQVLFMQRGAARVRLDSREIQLADGDLVFIPTEIVHGFVFRKGSEGLVLSFPGIVIRSLSGASKQVAEGLIAPFSIPAEAEARHLIARLAEIFAEGQSGTFRTTLLVAYSNALMAVLCADHAATRPDTPPATPFAARMRDFEALLTRHLAEGWGPGDYASALGVTPGHLNRICRAATGQSASRHIETAVMTEARRLLAFTRLSVSEIGYRLGFTDPPYFSRRFRSATGETPSDYRRRITE